MTTPTEPRSNLPTPASLAGFLVTQYCLPMIFEPGASARGTPVPGKTLSEDERRAIGVTAPGTTIGYRLDTVDVFLDLTREGATVWFTEGDFTAAAMLLEELLQKIFPASDLQLHPATSSASEGTRTRHLVVAPANSRRLAQISVTFGLPEAQGADRMFFARIFPQERLAS